MSTEIAIPDERTQLLNIALASEEDTPKLVFADWLEENGEGEEAEMIRLQIAIRDLIPPLYQWFTIEYEPPTLHPVFPYSSLDTATRPYTRPYNSNDPMPREIQCSFPRFIILVNEKQVTFNSARSYLSKGRLPDYPDPLRVGDKVTVHAPVAIGTPYNYYTFEIGNIEQLDHTAVGPGTVLGSGRLRSDWLAEVRLTPIPKLIDPDGEKRKKMEKRLKVLLKRHSNFVKSLKGKS